MKYDVRTRLIGSSSSAMVGMIGRRRIKSVQRGTITNNGTLTATGTITAVDPLNSLIFHLGNTTDDGANFTSVRETRIQLTNSTTVTSTVGNTPNIQVTSFEVVEYYPGVLRSVTRGTITMGGTASATLTVAVNDLTKSSLTKSGQCNAGNASASQDSLKLVFTNITTVTSTSAAVSGAITEAQVAEYWS